MLASHIHPLDSPTHINRLHLTQTPMMIMLKLSFYKSSQTTQKDQLGIGLVHWMTTKGNGKHRKGCMAIVSHVLLFRLFFAESRFTTWIILSLLKWIICMANYTFPFLTAAAAFVLVEIRICSKCRRKVPGGRCFLTVIINSHWNHNT